MNKNQCIKLTATLFLAIAFLWPGVSQGAKTKYRVFKPSGAVKGVFLKSGEKRYRYFAVEKGTSFGFDAVGPTKIKIRTRAELKSGIKDGEYEIQVWEGDNLIKGRKAKVKPSAVQLELNSDGIGVARTLVINVPRGKHIYRLWTTSEKFDRIYARFYQEKKKPKKVEYNIFKPYEFKKQVTLSTSKGSVAYYLVDNTGGVTLSVVGPTRLRIFCRANFDQSMKGNAKFSLGLYEKDQEAANFAGVAKMAQNLSFKEAGDIVPSKLHTFTFDVPAGRHLYEIKKINSTSPNLAVRFKIMKVGLGMVP
jgi:hypothetical protein